MADVACSIVIYSQISIPGRTRWYPFGLLVNLTCFVLVCLIFRAVVEWRRRHRSSFWQVSMGEFLIAIALICVPIGSENSYELIGFNR